MTAREPDHLDWIDEATGLACRIHRCQDRWLCGYVQVPQDHPLYEVDYSAPLPAELHKAHEALRKAPVGKRGILTLVTYNADSPTVDIVFDVHGSLTFAGPHSGDPPGTFWYGFDCGHAGDGDPPWYEGSFPRYDGVYRDIDYVKAECASLAKQLIALKELA